VPGGKGYAGQELKNLQGGHCQRDAAYGCDIMRHSCAKFTPLLPGYLFAGPSDIASDLMNKPGDIASQQPLQNGEKPALRGTSATAALIVPLASTLPAATTIATEVPQCA